MGPLAARGHWRLLGWLMVDHSADHMKFVCTAREVEEKTTVIGVTVGSGHAIRNAPESALIHAGPGRVITVLETLE
jgi:hypothetical protein